MLYVYFAVFDMDMGLNLNMMMMMKTEHSRVKELYIFKYFKGNIHYKRKLNSQKKNERWIRSLPQNQHFSELSKT
jgi:hypothetical protein